MICQGIAAMDATRISDGMKVMIKKTSPLTSETAVLRFLSSSPLKDDPSNHCVPVLDIFPDANDLSIVFVVMPLLREFYNPPFRTVLETIEFVRQTLKVGKLLLASCIFIDIQYRELATCIAPGLLICSFLSLVSSK